MNQDPSDTENLDPADEIPDLAAEMATDEDQQLRADLDEAKDRALRAQAELDNFRKRMMRELESERHYAGMPLLSDLLPVMDNIQRAIEAAEKSEPSEQASGLLEGVRLVAQQIEAVLAQHGCQPIPAQPGELFDPAVHEAVSQIPSPEFPQGVIAIVTRGGYQLHDRVIRPTQVIVSSGNE